jgi:hypothetical protein
VKETVNSVKNEVDKMNPVSDIKKEIDAEIKPIQDIKNMKNINPAKKEMDNLKKSK